MMALPLYMGKEGDRRGDDRQVTPLSVGTSEAAVDALCARHLEGRVKEPKLYDSRLSLYGLVQSMAFPAHMLVEHFRLCPKSSAGAAAFLQRHDQAASRRLVLEPSSPRVVLWRTRGHGGDNGVNEEGGPGRHPPASRDDP